jgi:ZIP family zinc transporter
MDINITSTTSLAARKARGIRIIDLGPMTPLKALGILINVLGFGVLLFKAQLYLQNAPHHVTEALYGGMIAALATALGAIPALLMDKTSQKVQDTMFGFGAGVMLAASAFSLIIPGLSAARGLGYGPWGANVIIGGAIMLGGAVMLWMEHTVPHDYFNRSLDKSRNASVMKRCWLFVFAIALHNFPEGLAIGTAFAGSDQANASALSIGIAIQDLPEGLVVALALLAAGYSRLLAISLGMLSGLIEPVGAVLGAVIVSYSAALLPWGLGFAAGCMLFVVSHEIIPESHSKGYERFATAGLVAGFVLMMSLDTALG